jgi:hypothetical protein
VQQTTWAGCDYYSIISVSAGERDGGISRPSILGGLAWMTNSRTWWMLNNQGSGTLIP